MLLYLLFEQAGAEAVCSANETSTGSEIILFSKSGSSDNENSKTGLGPVTETDVIIIDDPLLPGTHNERRQMLDSSSTTNLWDFISTITLLPDPTSEEIWASVTVTTGVFEGTLSLETLTLSFPDTSTLQESEEITTLSQLLTTITSSVPVETTFSSATDETSSSTTVALTTIASPTVISNGSSGLGAGEIAGIVVGGLVGLVVVAIGFLILAIFLRRRRQRRDEHPNIQLVSGPFPDPTERGSQNYLRVRPINPRPDLMMNGPTISEPAGPRLSGDSRGSGSAARPSEPGPSGVASGEEVSRDTIDAIIDGYSSSVYSQ
ncbi:hypothetical protein FALBO_6175 [Fusarium albosuccineum]|uniref:Mid2 domain-containing protein n=1 Tax=Fusarium albosuccineum TaxID=1237068 RepID=A0A8H4LC70_9HYPO|nr:hypothetical protein FALBO_6175 [Fusarium albosuccineum]